MIISLNINQSNEISPLQRRLAGWFALRQVTPGGGAELSAGAPHIGEHFQEVLTWMSVAAASSSRRFQL